MNTTIYSMLLPGERLSAGRRALHFVVASVLCLVASRVFLGVDFTDEAYYCVMAYRFVLGDQPFVDQIGFHQIASLLVTPFVGLFYWVTGGMDGVILFLRILFFSFCLCVTAVVYQVLRNSIGKNLAITTALLCVAYYQVTFSYNSQGCLFLLLGLMLIFHAIATDDLRRNCRIMMLAGLANGLAVMSYPTMVLPVLVSVGIALVYVAKSRFHVLAAFALGLFISMIPLLVLGTCVGWMQVFSCFLVSAKGVAECGQGGGISKVAGILMGLWRICLPDNLIVVGAIIIASLSIVRGQSPLRLALVGIVFLSLVGLQRDELGPVMSPSKYLIRLCAWSPFLYIFIQKEQLRLRRLFWCVGFPSLVAGFVTAWTSANGAINASVGLLPVAIVTIIMLASIIEDVIRVNKKLSQIWGAVPFIVLLLLIALGYRSIYSEGSPVHLTERVEKGPYRGLLTTEQKAVMMRSLINDLERYGRGEGKILFYDHFPAGYLFTTRRPASNTAWELPVGAFNSTRAGIMAHLAKSHNCPNIVFEMKYLYSYTGGAFRMNYSLDDPLCVFVKSAYELVAENDFFRVYNCRKGVAD